MKLEYLDNISNGGKYKDVVSENLVRLYDFDEPETESLADLILHNLINNDHKLDLSQVDFILSTNCKLILQTSTEDRGILRSDMHDSFICELTKETYRRATALMRAVDDGFNWLCDTSKDDIDFLYSPGGTW